MENPPVELFVRTQIDLDISRYCMWLLPAVAIKRRLSYVEGMLIRGAVSAIGVNLGNVEWIQTNPDTLLLGHLFLVVSQGSQYPLNKKYALHGIGILNLI